MDNENQQMGCKRFDVVSCPSSEHLAQLAAYILDWAIHPTRNPGLLQSFKGYFAWLITTQSPMSVHNAFRQLVVLTRTDAFSRSDATSTVIPYLAFSEARASLRKEG